MTLLLWNAGFIPGRHIVSLNRCNIAWKSSTLSYKIEFFLFFSNKDLLQHSERVHLQRFYKCIEVPSRQLVLSLITALKEECGGKVTSSLET